MQHNRKIIYLIGFLFSLPVALASYINSSFIASFVGEKFVGYIYILGSLSSIAGLLIAPTIFRKVRGYNFLLLVIFISACSFFAFSLLENTTGLIIMFTLGFVTNTLLVFSLDELLKIFSTESRTGKVRGTYLALSSAAWVLAQVASGTILADFSFRVIYLTSFVITMVLLFVVLKTLKGIPDPKYDNVKNLKYVGEFFKDSYLRRAYGMSFLLQFFFCWMVIYTPIYLYSHLHFSWENIGIIFAFMLLPFCIVPFHAGKYVDRMGERKMLMTGFAVTSFATFSLFFISGHTILSWAILLFFTRVGAAIIEVTSDSYFFKHIKAENDEFIGIYRSASPISYIIGPAIASLLFIMIPSFKFLYPILGAIMLYGVYLASTIKKSSF